MIRRELMKNHVEDPIAFRWRGGDVSRLEGFSDNVFGFALTLLVVSLEVPKSFGDLMGIMRGFVGFAICFALLAIIWHDHYSFFRRFGLEDGLTVMLNLVLLFLVMFYVYPLKFLFTIVAWQFTHFGPKPSMTNADWPTLMIIYSAGFVAVYIVFGLLYLNAYRQRHKLELNELELYDTRAWIGSDLVLIAIGLCSVLLASRRSEPEVMISGMMYWFIGPAMSIYWTIAGIRRRPLEKERLQAIAQLDAMYTETAVPAPPV